MSLRPIVLALAIHGALLTTIWVLVSIAVNAALAQVRVLRDAVGSARPRRLSARDTESAVAPQGPLPSLSIVVAARNEEAGIAATIERLLDQRYPGLQIVVVDDRSTDGTGAILDRLAAGSSPGSLDVVHVEAIPRGWLGKCHACRLGAERSRGEWLLFMDGDVTLAHPEALAGVLDLARGEGLDHLTVIPDMGPMPRLQEALVAVFGMTFLLATRAYEMNRDRRRGGGGVGAFNLVRRSEYDRVGGHERLRMDPADDIKLGQLLKESGARQRIFNGLDLVRCPWHEGTLNVIKGLEKNAFSGCRYSYGILAIFTIASLWLTFGPLATGAAATALLLAAPAREEAARRALLLGLAWLPLAVQVGLFVSGWLLTARRLRSRFSNVVLNPVAVVLLIAAMWNSAIRTTLRGGIAWRGTFYPLDDLRRGLVRPGDGRRLGGEESRTGAEASRA